MSFQHQLQKLEQAHQEKEHELQTHYENMMKQEQEKFERRFHSFHQRLHAKDKAYASLEAAFFRETKSAPTSPPTSPISSSFSTINDNSIQQNTFHTLQLEIQKSSKQQQKQIIHLKEQNKALEAELEEANRCNRRMEEQHAEKERLYVSQIDKLEGEVRDIKDKYAAQLVSSESRWKKIYMAENKDMAMRSEARVANLIAEHKQTLHDQSDAHQQELSVLEIKHQTELEKKEKEMKKEKKERLALTQQCSRVI